MAKLKKKKGKLHTYLLRYRGIKTLHIGIVVTNIPKARVVYALKGKMVITAEGYSPKELHSILNQKFGKIKLKVKQIA